MQIRFRVLSLSTLALIAVSCASTSSKKVTAKKAAPATVVTTPEPEISITLHDTVRKFGRDELLHSPLAQKITVENDPTYHTKMTYTAVPASLVFGGVDAEPGSTLLFTCTDGFSAPISAERVLSMNPSSSMAYIAVEEPTAPWPLINKGDVHKSAGPFYLIWQNPEASKIGSEEWPYQLTGFELKPPVEKQFPLVTPDVKLSESSSIKKGYRLFLQNCFSCHTMNGQGAATMGPDLNIPLSATEYLRAGTIEKIIRDPQSVRHWPQAKMSGFSATALPDADVKNILAYLKHMAGRKKKN
jgi:mono/diheme cytochrome c family protein